MTRIGLVTSSDIRRDPGGVAVSTLRLGNGLASRGFEIAFLSPDKRPPIGTERISIQRSTNGHPVPGDCWLVGPLAASRSSVERARQLRELLRATERWVQLTQPDVLLAIYAFPAGFAAVYAQEACGVPAIVSVRGNDVGRDLVNPRVSSFVSHALRRAAGLTFVSSRLRDFALALVSLGSEPRVIWNSVDLCGLPLPRDLPTQDSACMVGRLVEKKGVDVLLKAFEAPTLAHSNIRIELIGDFADVAYRAELTERFSDLQQGGRARVSGWLPRTQALARASQSRCVVAPSLDDGCPNSLLESFALGRATFASTTLREFYPPNADCLLFEVDDPDSLGNLIRRACVDASFSIATGDKLREWCSKAFSTRVELDAYTALINSLI